MCLDKKTPTLRGIKNLLKTTQNSNLLYIGEFGLGQEVTTEQDGKSHAITEKRIKHSLENYHEFLLKHTLLHHPQKHFCSSFHVANRLITEPKIKDLISDHIITGGQRIVLISNSYLHTHFKHIYYSERAHLLKQF